MCAASRTLHSLPYKKTFTFVMSFRREFEHLIYAKETVHRKTELPIFKKTSTFDFGRKACQKRKMFWERKKTETAYKMKCFSCVHLSENFKKRSRKSLGCKLKAFQQNILLFPDVSNAKPSDGITQEFYTCVNIIWSLVSILFFWFI